MSKIFANNIITYLKTSMIARPSAFVMFFRCPQSFRWKLLITPPRGTSIRREIRFCLATPHGYNTRFSSRHNQGGNITFSDGHSAHVKYSYIVADGTEVAARWIWSRAHRRTRYGSDRRHVGLPRKSRVNHRQLIFQRQLPVEPHMKYLGHYVIAFPCRLPRRSAVHRRAVARGGRHHGAARGSGKRPAPLPQTRPARCLGDPRAPAAD